MPNRSRLLLIAALLPALLLAAAGTACAGNLPQRVLDAAQQQRRVRVLVMLRDPDSTQTLASESTRLRRQHVSAAVDAVVRRLALNASIVNGNASTGYLLRRRFALVPAIAIETDAATLQRLRDDPDITSIDLDLPGSGNSVSPDESSVLNNVSPLQGLGFDGAGMKVVVIDSGINTHHPDLLPHLVGQQCFCSSASGSGGCCPNGQATQSGTGSGEDSNGHGTNVAGIIVGQGNVAPRGAVPATQLEVVKVVDANNRFCCSSDIIAAMDWVASNHPDVDAVNLSLGTDTLFAGDCDNANATTQAMASALNALIARGAVVTVSTGNAGSSAMTAVPACLHNATGVSATWDFTGGAQTFLGCTDTSTASRKPTCFTNRSTTTDLYAAGAFVTSTGIDGGASTFGGTSQAAPMVAACAIALKQAAPAFTVAQREEAMRLSRTQITDPVSGRSYPFLDCIDALHLVAGFMHATGDVDGDGKADVLWRNSSTDADVIWKSANASTQQLMPAVTSLAWNIIDVGDFNADGKWDLYWRNRSTGANLIWHSGFAVNQQTVATVNGPGWQIASVGDYDGDGRSDLVWRNFNSGANLIWLAADASTSQALQSVTNLAWRIVP